MPLISVQDVPLIWDERVPLISDEAVPLINKKYNQIMNDQDIDLTGFYAQSKYPKRLQIVQVYNEIND